MPVFDSFSPSLILPNNIINRNPRIFGPLLLILSSSSPDARFVLVDLLSGKVLRTVKADNQTYAYYRPFSTKNGDIFIVSGGTDFFLKMDKKNLNILKTSLPAGFYAIGGNFDDPNYLYIGVSTNAIKKLRTSDFGVEWTFTGSDSPSNGSITCIAANSTHIFTGNDFGYYRKVDITTSTQVWVKPKDFITNTTGVSANARCIMVTSDSVYMGHDSGITRLDLNGNLVWSGYMTNSYDTKYAADKIILYGTNLYTFKLYSQYLYRVNNSNAQWNATHDVGSGASIVNLFFDGEYFYIIFSKGYDTIIRKVSPDLTIVGKDIIIKGLAFPMNTGILLNRGVPTI